MKEFRYAGGILVGLIIVLTLVYISTKRSKLRTDGKYTIGITIGRNGKFIKYKFNVQGKDLLSEYPSLKFNPEANGGRYFVKYSSSDLTVSEIYWDKPVPDYIMEAPPEGWTSIPLQ